MVNPKKTKINKALERVPKNKLGDHDILSNDLAQRIGSLEDKNKITIRLDARVLDAAKREANQSGVGYQKIINDRLLEIYSLDETPYLSLRKQIEELDKRLNKVENERVKKRA